ncbi:DUF4328 domain-containing protein [Nannocystaceae bacterium ST9]
MERPNPFQPPRDDEPEFAESESGLPIKPVGALNTALVGMLGLVGLLNLALLPYLVIEITAFTDLIAGRPIDVAGIQAKEQQMGVLAWASVAGVLGTALIWWIWATRAANNLRTFGVEYLEFDPRALVWWWFVPIFQWIRPYQGIAELWKASAASATGKPNDWPSLEPPKYFQLWWAMWLARSILSAISQQMTKTEDLETLRTAFVLDLAGCLATLVAAPLAALVVTRISRDQARAFEQQAARRSGLRP